jgi:hypothetical protein
MVVELVVREGDEGIVSEITEQRGNQFARCDGVTESISNGNSDGERLGSAQSQGSIEAIPSLGGHRHWGALGLARELVDEPRGVGDEPESLVIYTVLTDVAAERDGDLRVIDESGEDYLFSADRFVAIEVPAAVRASLLKAAQG